MISKVQQNAQQVSNIIDTYTKEMVFIIFQKESIINP